METTAATAAATSIAAVKPRPRGMRLTIVSFAVCIVALFAAAIVMSSVVADSADAAYMWSMVLLGAVVITLLMSAVFVPHLKEFREHK